MFNLRCRINGEGCGGGSKGGTPGAETAIWTKFRLECEEYPFSTSYLSPDCPMFNLRCRINGEGCGGGSKGGAPGAETAIWPKLRLECEQYPLASSNPVFSAIDSVWVGTPNCRAGKRFNTGTDAEFSLDFEE
jgi:hypothetical protein